MSAHIHTLGRFCGLGQNTAFLLHVNSMMSGMFPARSAAVTLQVKYFVCWSMADAQNVVHWLKYLPHTLWMIMISSQRCKLTNWMIIISLKGVEGFRCGVLWGTIWSAIWTTTTATSHKKSVSRVGSHIRTQTAHNLNRILHMFQPDCFQSQWLCETKAQNMAWSK